MRISDWSSDVCSSDRVVIGVDHLDRINTGYGYEAGNAVLVEIGRRLDSCLRAADVIGRPGGDFFGAILSACSEEAAQLAAERVLQSLRDNPVATPGGRSEEHTSELKSLMRISYAVICSK